MAVGVTLTLDLFFRAFRIRPLSRTSSAFVIDTLVDFCFRFWLYKMALFLSTVLEHVYSVSSCFFFLSLFFCFFFFLVYSAIYGLDLTASYIAHGVTIVSFVARDINYIC